MPRVPKNLPAWLTNPAAPIAHRGLHRIGEGVPENSGAAFEAAARRGLPVEMDVLLSADGQVVVFHDADLQRVTGATGKVGETPIAALQSLRLLGTDEPIPLLRDVLTQIAGRVPLLIEIKNLGGKVGPLEQATLDALTGYGGEFALQSFNPLSLRYVRRAAPQIIRGQLAERGGAWKGNKFLRYALRNLLFNFLSRPHFIAYAIDELPVRAVTRARRAGLPLIVWTIRSEAQRVKALAMADNYIFETVSPP